MKSGPIIRNDDVLQTMDSTTSHQRADLDGRTLFEAFLEADAVFEKYNYPCTLAVLSEGLGDEEWVGHIKKNLHRYKIELHGSIHQNYKNASPEYLLSDLGPAVEDIEETFGTKITTWYPPFGRKGTPACGDFICNELGIEQYHQVGKVDAKFWLKHPERYPHVNMHYWNRPQVKHVEQICRQLAENS